MSILSIYTKGEPHLICYLWRWALGWAELLDGILRILSLGFVNLSLPLWVAGRLVVSRIKS
jgi:hypothetical protein